MVLVTTRFPGLFAGLAAALLSVSAADDWAAHAEGAVKQRPISRATLGATLSDEEGAPPSEVSRLLRREGASSRRGLHIARASEGQAGPSSALQVDSKGDQPFSLTATRWYHSTNVTFANTHTDIPKGGWIMSMSELERPTIVEAEIRSAGKSGPVGMTLFAEDHALKESLYSITTGYGKWHDSALSMPGDERITVGFNNEADKWSLVKFDLQMETIKIFINDNLIHNSTNTELTRGSVQFVADKEPMQVRGVRWRRDCEFTSWEAGPCSVSCGHGTLKSTRVQLAPALFGGSCKGGIERSDKCYKGPCEGFDMR